MCVDGRKQRNTPNKSDATPSTVANKPVLTTTAIDECQNKNIAVIYALCELITAEIDEGVVLVIE